MTARQRKQGLKGRLEGKLFLLYLWAVSVSMIVGRIYWFRVGWEQCGREWGCWEAAALQPCPSCLWLYPLYCIVHMQMWTKTSQKKKRKQKNFRKLFREQLLLSFLNYTCATLQGSSIQRLRNSWSWSRWWSLGACALTSICEQGSPCSPSFPKFQRWVCREWAQMVPGMGFCNRGTTELLSYMYALPLIPMGNPKCFRSFSVSLA